MEWEFLQIFVKWEVGVIEWLIVERLVRKNGIKIIIKVPMTPLSDIQFSLFY